MNSPPIPKQLVDPFGSKASICSGDNGGWHGQGSGKEEIVLVDSTVPSVCPTQPLPTYRIVLFDRFFSNSILGKMWNHPMDEFEGGARC
jgi:hypothetical protein